MPRNKSITSIDNRIKKVQEDLFKTKARLDKLTAELRGLEREKKFRQADAILQALQAQRAILIKKSNRTLINF